MNKVEIRHKAYEMIANRRQQAQAEANHREQEIIQKFPVIAEYKAELARTNSELTRCIIKKDADYKKNFERIRRGNTECQRLIADTLRRAGYPEDYLNVHYRCTKCSDMGYTDKGVCECLIRAEGQIAAEELNRDANIPTADFEHFDISYYKGGYTAGQPNEKIMSIALNAVKKYADEFSEKSGNLLFIGNPGLGKTHLAMAVAKTVAQKGYTVIYGSVINQFRKIENEHFGHDHADTTLDLMLGCDLLIIDDLGVEIPSSFYESVLYTIINSRINSAKPTIVTTNLTLNEMKGRYNTRILSRLSFNFEMIGFVGQDIRAKKDRSGLLGQ